MKTCSFLRSTATAWIAVAVLSAAKAETAVYFSPHGLVASTITRNLYEAKTSIDVAIYAIAENGITTALLKQRSVGLTVHILTDASQQQPETSTAPKLRHAGLDVRIGNQPGLMHEKFAVIDGRTLLVGSANWSASADQRNAENLIVTDDAKLVATFAKHFAEKWAKSLPFRMPTRSRQFTHSPERAFTFTLGPLARKDFVSWHELPVRSTRTTLVENLLGHSCLLPGKVGNTPAAW